MAVLTKTFEKSCKRQDLTEQIKQEKQRKHFHKYYSCCSVLEPAEKNKTNSKSSRKVL